MENIGDTIIGLEKAALERWNAGDPDGYIELYDTDISYFDPAQKSRIDGLDNMIAYYGMARGKSTVTSYEMISPFVHIMGDDSAVLSYNLHQVTPEREYLWHCTQVYGRRSDGKWKIAHNHWSLVTASE